MNINKITITNANIHNLQNISIEIPKNKFIVITGPSGSGKSSLVFDTIYTEGQRRYIESLSSYARQFLGQHQAPDVESITGLSPAIAIDQKTINKNPRSTVGTITEIYDYMRVLFSKVGTLYCPETGKEIKKYSPSQVVNEIFKYKENSKVIIMAPLTFCSQKDLFNTIGELQTTGLTRVRLNNEIFTIEDLPKTFKKKIKTADIIIDRLLIRKNSKQRMIESVEYAMTLTDHFINVLINNEYLTFSEHLRDPKTLNLITPIEPQLFSFNSPIGACSKCNGIGQTKDFEEHILIQSKDLSIPNGAISIISKRNRFMYKMILCVASTDGVDISLPYKKLPASFRKILFHGSNEKYLYKFKTDNSTFEFNKKFPGLLNWAYKKYLETGSDKKRAELEKFMSIKECSKCEGNRLNSTALNVKVNNFNICELSNQNISYIYNTILKFKFNKEKKEISSKLVTEIISRLKFLLDVGLDYLTLSRPSGTLSGGEGQRIRLATQIGSALSGVIYALDEPSIGLHQSDNDKLINTLKSLRDLGNTVIVVEHDETTIKSADHIIDIGPGAGSQGGNIIVEGKLNKVLKNKKSITSKFLNGKETLFHGSKSNKINEFISLKGASLNNLNNINVKIPIEGFTCVTGVSGSGKSTLIHDVLVPAIKDCLNRTNLLKPDVLKSISGVDKIKSIIELDQGPIGKSPNSNPATYSGVFSHIRELFSKTKESLARGYTPGRFSFNIKGGRCSECEGNGVKKIEMHFLPDVYIKCNECNGSRFNSETLSIIFKGKNIDDVLNLTIDEALNFFIHHKKIHRILNTLNNVGLGYMKLGQPATTLSGGEAQRLKLSKELAKSVKGRCLYILDEPTTGLHFKDIKVLLFAINELINSGHSVLVIEHNMDVIKTADHIIDLGPGGGDRGGKIIGEGTPKEIAKIKNSLTGKYLKSS